ncbi:hypothetical protein F5I97DRAFT_236309 [Phlebopus sp. FC_14]|nr:hypothetical protein F5I97DRAFT_236309 [Phlebopus sp. FC_14]
MYPHSFQDNRSVVPNEIPETSTSHSGLPSAIETRQDVAGMSMMPIPFHRPDQDPTSLQSPTVYSDHYDHGHQVQGLLADHRLRQYPPSSSRVGLPLSQLQGGQLARSSTTPYNPPELYPSRYGNNGASVQTEVGSMNQTLPLYTLLPNNVDFLSTTRTSSEGHQSYPSDTVALGPRPHYYMQQGESTSQPSVPSTSGASNGSLLPGGLQAELAEYAERHYSGQPCFYRCLIDRDGETCNTWIVGDRPYISKHLRSCHPSHPGNGYATCRWDGCPTVMKKDNLPRHIVTHLNIKWKCPHCREEFSRDDAVHRHLERVSSGMDQVAAIIHSGTNLPLD